MPDRLATAQWEDPAAVSKRYPFTAGKFWLGHAEDGTGLGYRDDRHICLVSGTRGGKGTSIIINNLCLWPGSAVVVDPKGENATVTAARRGQGSEHCAGMGQAVHVLDPFNVTQVDERYRSRFNPLAELDPEREETIDEASRLANEIVVVKDERADPFWDEAARSMLRGLILHVLSAPEFKEEDRNLITVRGLILRGHWQLVQTMRDMGIYENQPPHELLWQAMERNPAFNGLVSGVGSRFRSMMNTAAKTFEGVLQACDLNTEFLDSPGMRRTLAHSDFKLSDLKTKPEGMTLYLSLPQRHMDTHYRWLRMMVVLTCTQMEITRGQPATGHRVLIALDEFAGLKRMAAIESAVAQLAGFGVKLLFVLQSLEQLKSTYKDAWETFLANAGLKIFFSIEDHFTQEYVSKLVGETEIIREVHSSNESQSENESHAQTASTSRTQGTSVTYSVNQSQSASQSESIQRDASLHRSLRNTYLDPATVKTLKIASPNVGGFLTGRARGNWGISQSTTEGTSASFGKTESSTDGTSQTSTAGTSRTAGIGRSETVHRRPLIQPDEIGRFFARIDEITEPAYPGLALVIVAGTANPMVVRRAHYFEDPLFIECFSPNPDYEFMPPVSRSVEESGPSSTNLKPPCAAKS
jgi:type IV secretory pathway TraG/TraD family ATPase VirD4